MIKFSMTCQTLDENGKLTNQTIDIEASVDPNIEPKNGVIDFQLTPSWEPKAPLFFRLAYQDANSLAICFNSFLADNNPSDGKTTNRKSTES
jgi:hypothetical protein